MVTVPYSDPLQCTADGGTGAGGGASDTESNSERDHEVRKTLSRSHSGLELCDASSCCQADRTESEAARSRLSSVSSSVGWSANSDWVSTSLYLVFGLLW